ncbi:hypothetical protein [Methylophilus sp. 5]|uniref:hypothetical protein n=1 Tax=Methylophilus sp. 5 TaxID=1112274 RepID=UPI00049054F2|nr:hypothetical protein [Methylophilus sp. 5]
MAMQDMNLMEVDLVSGGFAAGIGFAGSPEETIAAGNVLIATVGGIVGVTSVLGQVLNGPSGPAVVSALSGVLSGGVFGLLFGRSL